MTFQFRFKTEIRAPGVFTGFVGAGNGINAPANYPKPVAPGTPIVPPAITSLDGPGSTGLSLRQTYTVTAIVGGTMRRRIDHSIATFRLYQCIRPLAIGLVHGLAGSAAIALLVLSTIHNPYWATVYLVIFGVGTMIGMMSMTAAIAVPLTYAGDRFANLSRYFGVASGMVSLCFGSFLVYQLGFLGGLFTSHPHWTPQ